jgi:5-methylcytosine-specific restriction endonuclease McrA
MMASINERERSRRRRREAVQKRAELIQKLGGKCVECGSTEFLEIDHIHGKAYEASKLGSSDRIRRYMKEYEQGLLQVLCKSCNSAKGHPQPQPEFDITVEQPF